MKNIIEYIKQKYNPLSIIVYGSYADGSNNAHSDFDALVITKDHENFHDVSFIEKTQLDVFVYPSTYFDNDIDCKEFVQIFDGNIVMDTNQCGEKLKKRIIDYMANLPCKTEEELYTEVEWCKKMFLRTKRNDTEGMFRWHWVLTESLEIFCDLMHHPYRGPKKGLRWMKNNYFEAYQLYTEALFCFDVSALENWINYLDQFIQK